MLLFARTQSKGLQEMTTRWVRIRLTLNQSYDNSNDANMSDVGESDNEEISQHSETITLRGVSFHVEFQNTISRCRKNITENQPILTRFRRKPDNDEDRNAVAVEVFLQGHWKPMSYIYIPGNKVPKVQAALTNLLISSSMFPLL